VISGLTLRAELERCPDKLSGCSSRYDYMADLAHQAGGALGSSGAPKERQHIFGAHAFDGEEGPAYGMHGRLRLSMRGHWKPVRKWDFALLSVPV